jgi:hypothetical protein
MRNTAHSARELAPSSWLAGRRPSARRAGRVRQERKRRSAVWTRQYVQCLNSASVSVESDGTKYSPTHSKRA